MKRKIQQKVSEELKSLPAGTPKYTFSQNQSRAITDVTHDVDVVRIKASYAANPASERAIILNGSRSCCVEEYACCHFHSLGYNALRVEGVPIHVLFGVYMWPVIQDPEDSHNRVVSFGDRHAFDARVAGELISTHLPDDFGTQSYVRRRAATIEKHLSAVMCQPGELRPIFDRWLGPSEGLRQYLWAHRNKQIRVARQLIDVLPATAIIEILRYLVEDYWGRYAGWPDLLVYRDEEFFFAEVKSSSDKLGENQKRWIRDNHQRLHLPFKLVKVDEGVPGTSSSVTNVEFENG